MVYGSERGDTEETKDGKIICGDKDNGFVSIYNWALLGSGEYTAQAYDDGVPFGREHRFRVTKAGRNDDDKRNYVTGAEARVEVSDFPASLVRPQRLSGIRVPSIWR